MTKVVIKRSYLWRSKRKPAGVGWEGSGGAGERSQVMLKIEGGAGKYME